MQNALPRLQKNIAVPLAALALGAAGGSALVALLDEDNALTLPSANPSAEIQATPAQSETPSGPNKFGARP
jgi:hypothetical protein